MKLKIICARDIFATRATNLAKKLGVSHQVEFLGYVKDQDFPKVYSQALALVHPAFLEGFSLTGLEAMSQSCPVIASNTSCMPEIYGKSVLYFNPNNCDELVAQINKLQNNPKLREQLIKLGHAQVAKYSWQKCAQETISFYEKIIG
jgi:glycosyltransferase involved in cell wall biosynthesis